MGGQIFDFGRCRSFIGLGLLLALMLEAINTLLILIYGWNPPATLPLKFTEVAESKARNLERIFPPSSDRAEPFLVYLGASSAAEAIDAQRLAADDAYGAPVCGICGIFPGFKVTQLLAEPLIRRGVRPRTVVLCIHTGYLAVGPKGGVNESPSIGEFVKSLLSLQHITRNRTRINNSIRQTIFQMRQSLEIAEPDQSPWVPPDRMGYAHHNPSEYLKTQFAALSKAGWFDTEAYALVQERNADILIDLLRHFHRFGSDTRLVLLPEHTALRDGIPQSAHQYLRDRLLRDLGDVTPEIWNFVDTIPDHMFADYIHVNDDGRSKFTELLADKLRDDRLSRP